MFPKVFFRKKKTDLCQFSMILVEIETADPLKSLFTAGFFFFYSDTESDLSILYSYMNVIYNLVIHDNKKAKC